MTKFSDFILFPGTASLKIRQGIQQLGFALSSSLPIFGTMATQNANNVSITGGGISGLDTPLAIPDGGTGAVTPIGAIDALSVRGGAIASAATTNIGAATGSFVHITGSVTITSLGVAAAGVERTVVFDAAPIITHNGTSLILPNAANIQASAGDVARFVSEGSGNWRCTEYQYASPFNTIASGSFPTANFVDITNIPQSYSRLMLVISGVSFDTAARQLFVLVNTDNSGYAGNVIVGGSVFPAATYAATFSNQAAAETASLVVEFTGYQAGLFTKVSSAGHSRVGGTPSTASGDVIRLSSSAMTTIRMIMDSTGNFDGGTYALIGYR